MAKTLLNGINEVLKRTKFISGDAGAFTSLTDSSRQRPIDIAVQAWNEAVDELYSVGDIALPNEQAESTITLVDGTRAYTLATDLVQLRWPFIDRTNNQYITEYTGGYNKFLVLDPEQDDTGLPHWGAIRPTDGKLFLDRAPTSVEAGRVYYYQYDKDTVLDEASDTFPFSDAVFRAMVPAVAQIWRRDMNNDFDAGLYRVNLGRAARFLTQQQVHSSWSPR
jgi:hypothetical protein